MLKEFKDFVMRGNVLDMAVGIILGTAFGAIIKSLVDDILMPPIGLLLGGVDFANLFIVLRPGTPPPPYPSLAEAQAAGAVTLNYGLFINAIVYFLIIAFAIFMIVRTVQRWQEEEAPAEPTTKTCPYCYSEIPIQAVRCPYCTSELPTS
ncbi:MAG: large-conductance mechanosensitive channel protein MscL [Chloroflexi bacterium]|nr:large-conductance mechanosensitive channel protein MscL [Chloroflexota bacterium]